MKKTIIMLLLCLLCEAAALAIPAYPRKHAVKQPDGSQIMLMGHGDEFNNFLTDDEGYRVELGADGFYRRVVDAQTGKPLARYSAPAQKHSALKLQQRAATLGRDMQAQPLRTSQEQPYRGLVLLVDFNDRKFRFDDTTVQQFYSDMIGSQNYQGYTDPKYGTLACPGSLRDYFADNSYGRFDPEFDVVGPIHVDVSQYYINMVDNAFPLMEMVLAAADTLVDFSKYDSNGDGDVDMFYVIFAGYSSQYSGNDTRLMWPFAATMVDESGEDADIIYDNVRVARFACSSEIYGWQQDNDKYLEGIGVMAHEFAHVLGFVDHYDTSGGYQEHPNTWDLMSAGSYNGVLNNTPCALNAYEKWSAGFMTPTDISNFDDQEITLSSIETSEDALVLHNLQEHVHLYMENRQADKWDKGLMHHGLLVWCVDSVRPEYWQQNVVNVSSRACMRLVRADGTKGSWLSGVEDSSTDPFPGTANITTLDNENRKATLLSYDGYPSPVYLDSITEQNRKITLTVKVDEEAESRPITYAVLKKMRITAEKLVEGSWVTKQWNVVSGKKTVNGAEQYVLYNLLPNDLGLSGYNSLTGIPFVFTYGIDGKSITINAQRFAADSEKSIWFCNYNDVENGGAGSLVLNMNRYGLLSVTDPATTLNYVSLTPTAFMVSASKVQEQLVTYRNITFEEVGSGTGIEQTDFETVTSGKRLVDGELQIHINGTRYNAMGRIIR